MGRGAYARHSQKSNPNPKIIVVHAVENVSMRQYAYDSGASHEVPMSDALNWPEEPKRTLIANARHIMNTWFVLLLFAPELLILRHPLF